MDAILFDTCIFSFIVGTIAGSAMKCLGERVSNGKKWMIGRSKCDHCGHVLNWQDLIPVVSFLWNRGKCRYCGHRISSGYVWTELSEGFVFLIIFLKEGALDGTVLMEWCICATLLALSITDINCYLIPDRFNLFLILLWGIRIIKMEANGRLNQLLIMNSLSGAFIPSALVLMLSLIMSRLLRKESIGGGDIKLLFALGLHIGLLKSFLLLIIACVFGVISAVIAKQQKIPFGPCISLGMVLTIIFGQKVIMWVFAI